MWRKADTKFHFRDRPARERGRGGRIVDEDSRNVTLSGPLRAGKEGLKRVVDFGAPIGAPNRGHVFVTPEEPVRKRGLLTVFVTRSHLRHEPVFSPSPIRGARARLPPLLRRRVWRRSGPAAQGVAREPATAGDRRHDAAMRPPTKPDAAATG